MLSSYTNITRGLFVLALVFGLVSSSAAHGDRRSVKIDTVWVVEGGAGNSYGHHQRRHRSRHGITVAQLDNGGYSVTSPSNLRLAYLKRRVLHDARVSRRDRDNYAVVKVVPGAGTTVGLCPSPIPGGRDVVCTLPGEDVEIVLDESKRLNELEVVAGDTLYVRLR